MSDVSISIGVEGKEQTIAVFHEVGQASKEFGNALLEHTKKLGELFLGYESVVKVVEQFKAAIEMGGQLSELSEQTGVSAGKLVILQKAFENTGMSAEDVGGSFAKMQKFLEAASEDGSKASDDLRKIGLSADELKGQKPEELYRTLANQIGSLHDQSLKTSSAMEIFGKSGYRALTLFSHFDEEIKDAKDSLGGLPEMADKNADAFQKVGDGLKEIAQKGKEFAFGALAPVIDSLGVLTDKLKDFKAADYGKEIFQSLSEPVKALLELLASGEFKKSFGLLFDLFKLQGEKMINEAVRIAQSIGAAIQTVFGEIFGGKSQLGDYLMRFFRLMGDFLKQMLYEGIGSAIAGIPGLGKQSDALLESAKMQGDYIASDMLAIKSGANAAAVSLEKVSEKAAKAGLDTYRNAADVIDTASQAAKVNAAAVSGLEIARHDREQEKPHQAASHEEKREVAGYSGTKSYSFGTDSGKTGKTTQNVDPAQFNLNTGIFKNTENLPGIVQAQLATASDEISKGPIAKLYQERIQRADKSGDFATSRSLELENKNRERAEATEYLRRHMRDNREMNDYVQKNGGPVEAAKKLTGAAGAAKEATPMDQILKLIADHLPKIDTNTAAFAVLT